MDMYMPICTGVEATRAMRQIPDFQVLPVVYLSSETDVAQQVEALRLGGDQFLIKPINPVMLASVVKTKIERYRDLLRLSRHDSLTGLLNHSAGKQRVDRLIRSAGKGGKLAVAMIDIDRFKSINDNFGHPVGDQVIRGLAWLLGARLRACDLVCRYGGEEFLLALPGASLEEAVKVIDNVRETFASLAHPHAKGILHSSFSGGVAALPHFVSGSTLIKAADDALLTAKREGRNCIVAARDENMSTPIPLDESL
jgi:diguanylate cyclase (GGDEF)-like protein